MHLHSSSCPILPSLIPLCFVIVIFIDTVDYINNRVIWITIQFTTEVPFGVTPIPIFIETIKNLWKCQLEESSKKVSTYAGSSKGNSTFRNSVLEVLRKNTSENFCTSSQIIVEVYAQLRDAFVHEIAFFPLQTNQWRKSRDYITLTRSSFGLKWNVVESSPIRPLIRVVTICSLSSGLPKCSEGSIPRAEA